VPERPANFVEDKDPSLARYEGERWAEIRQLALLGSSSSLHSEACDALGASDGVIHSSISLEIVSLRATTNEMKGEHRVRVVLVGVHGKDAKWR
jgi:hypothetical protein